MSGVENGEQQNTAVNTVNIVVNTVVWCLGCILLLQGSPWGYERREIAGMSGVENGEHTVVP